MGQASTCRAHWRYQLGPIITDDDIDEDDVWYDAMSDMPDKQADSLFDEFGNYRRRVIVSEAQVTRHDLEDHLLPTDGLYYQAHERQVKHKEPNYEKLNPKFGWLSTDVIKKTYDATTQYARIPMSTLLTKHFKSPHPALNACTPQTRAARYGHYFLRHPGY
jgi:hypothetical protein